MDNSQNPFDNEKEMKLESDVTPEALEEMINNDENKQDVAEDNGSEPVKNNLEEQLEELNNKYLRLAADFDNFRKRTATEKQELLKYGASEVLKKILVVLDTFDRAKESLKDIDNCQTVKESYEVAFKQLLDTLKKIGVEEIEALGKEFDPNCHEAVTQIPTDEYEPDCVAAVVQKGYKLSDKILRPALVGVAKKKENE